MAGRLVISCPSCGAPNAATVAACVHCGANLNPEAALSNAPPDADMAGANDVQATPLGAGDSSQTEAAAPPAASVQTPRNWGSPKVRSKASIASLGSQAVFYVGCAILILIPILLVGLGPLRVMLGRIFQH